MLRASSALILRSAFAAIVLCDAVLLFDLDSTDEDRPGDAFPADDCTVLTLRRTSPRTSRKVRFRPHRSLRLMTPRAAS
jgi:hypothetical protein